MRLRVTATAVAAMVLVAGEAVAVPATLPIAVIETQTADWLDISNDFEAGYALGDAENEPLSVDDVSLAPDGGFSSGYLNGAMLLEVKEEPYADADGSVERGGDGWETVTSTGRIKGFDATVEYGFWMSNRATGRAIYSFRNPKRVTRKITVRVGTSLAWGGSPEIVSEGTPEDPNDPSIDPSDSWFYASDGEEDFRAVIFGLGDRTNHFDEVPDADSGTLIQTFTFKIKPKKTKSVMVFVQPAGDTAISGTVLTEAEVYNNGESVAAAQRVDDLSTTERAGIVNWDLPAPD